jgi:hypothetical protein
MSEKCCLPKSARQGRIALLTIVVIGLTTFALPQIKADNIADEITGTVSKAEPPNKQDGSPAHPYADASQCPPTADFIFWPKTERVIPSIPPGISVCFVGNQPFNSSGPAQIRIRD